MMEEVLRRARAAGEKRMEFTVLGALAWVATSDGRPDQALALLRDAYSLRGSVARTQVALLFARAALAHAVAGRAELAALLLGRHEAMREELGEADPAWVSEQKQEARSLIRAALDEETITRSMEAGRAMSADEAIARAFATIAESG